MMPILRKLRLTFIMAGLLPSLLAAAEPGSQQLSLEGGAAFPTSANHFSDFAMAGPVAGIQYLSNWDNSLAWGVQADYYHFGEKTRLLTSPAGGQIEDTSQNYAETLEVMGRYTFLPDARFAPYIHSGLGVNYFHQKADGTPAAGSTWSDTNTTESRQLQDVGTVGVSYSIGLGVETNLTQSLVLGLETAWHIFGVSKTSYGTGTIDVPTVTMRLGWRFGAKPIETEPTPDN